MRWRKTYKYLTPASKGCSAYRSSHLSSLLSQFEADYHYDVMSFVFLNRIEAATDTASHNAHYYSKTKKEKNDTRQSFTSIELSN